MSLLIYKNGDRNVYRHAFRIWKMTWVSIETCSISITFGSCSLF